MSRYRRILRSKNLFLNSLSPSCRRFFTTSAVIQSAASNVTTLNFAQGGEKKEKKRRKEKRGRKVATSDRYGSRRTALGCAWFEFSRCTLLAGGEGRKRRKNEEREGREKLFPGRQKIINSRCRKNQIEPPVKLSNFSPT